ncbi:MAG: phenylalanine--tRNA ligase subunit beta [Chloroherpetonaceae bacterium]|nr:phenylalanine--tRNA ligase subunit beta [Chthonomonadaceae bacterium]MDW8206457.1 phenylalanine--tRNA ligase subunit beta [Chloroherpetonaceae bacterium]
MRVPVEWLKQFVPVQASAEEIATRLTMGGLEVEGLETAEEVYHRALREGCSEEVAHAAAALAPVLDVYVTPNRGDCNSVIGVAREVAALYNLPLTLPHIPPSVEGDEAARQTSVQIEDLHACPRYAARLVRDVRIAPSPVWMQARLLATGQRPINNVVDVTNYVMLEMGQPLHAFDLDRLEEGRIVVRRARTGEVLRTLDGVARTLAPDMLIIADARRPVAVAGVMGGADSEVDEVTRNILLEAAHFDPRVVRRTARDLGLRTEASYRFERVVDPNGVRRAADRACALFVEIGLPLAVPGVVDVYPNPMRERTVRVRVSRAAQLLGMEISCTTAMECLQRLGLTAAPDGNDSLQVTVPTFRPDITLEEDLIEEIGRVHGYENIPETLPIGATTQGGDSAEGRFLTTLRQHLVQCGLQEVTTHSLTPPFPFDPPEDVTRRVMVRNALSAEISVLRRSLLPGLLDVAHHNVKHGVTAMGLFEIGRVWQNEGEAGEVVPAEHLAVGGLVVGAFWPSGWQKEGAPPVADFGTARGIVERLCAGLGIPELKCLPPDAQPGSLPQFHPGRTAWIFLGDAGPAGVVGEVHPRVSAEMRLRDRVYVFELRVDALQNAIPPEGPRYLPLSPFPSVVRDLAPRIPEEVPYAEVDAAVRAAEAPHLEHFYLTDLYRGHPLPEGLKSLTLRFTFRSTERTLSDADVNDALSRIRTSLETRCRATFVA